MCVSRYEGRTVKSGPRFVFKGRGVPLPGYPGTPWGSHVSREPRPCYIFVCVTVPDADDASRSRT